MGGNFEIILKNKLWKHGERGVVAILFHAGLKEVHVCLSVCLSVCYVRLLFDMSVCYWLSVLMLSFFM